MSGMHPATLPPIDQYAALMRSLVDRVRALEARQSAAQLAVVPAAGFSTGSATPAALCALLGSAPAGWSVALTVQPLLSDPAAVAGLLLLDARGYRIADKSPLVSGVSVTLAADGAAGPYTLQGYTSSGTLEVLVQAAYAAPYSTSADDAT